jgi:Ala-tRNA(Pro) deacylase
MPYVEKNIKRILAEKNIEFEEFQHEAVYTSEQAARVRGLNSAKAGIKSMIFKTETGKFILVLNPGDRKVDTKKIAKMEKAKHLSIAKPEEVEKVAGVPIGCVAPFGLKTKLKTYLNEELLKSEYLYFNPGLHTKTVEIRAADLLQVLENPIRFT